jgi:hypothetical protein
MPWADRSRPVIVTLVLAAAVTACSSDRGAPDATGPATLAASSGTPSAPSPMGSATASAAATTAVAAAAQSTSPPPPETDSSVPWATGFAAPHGTRSLAAPTGTTATSTPAASKAPTSPARTSATRSSTPPPQYPKACLVWADGQQYGDVFDEIASDFDKAKAEFPSVVTFANKFAAAAPGSVARSADSLRDSIDVLADVVAGADSAADVQARIDNDPKVSAAVNSIKATTGTINDWAASDCR